MKTLLFSVMLLAVLFLTGCSSFAKRDIQSATDISKLTPKEQTTVYITKTLNQTNWLVTICLFGIGVGFFAFLSGNGIGFKIMASCAVVICGALVLASAAAWIAVATKWVIIIAVIAAAVAAILLLYAIFVKGRALKEIVENVEGLKKVTIGARYLDTATSKNILSKQSPSTQAVVSSIKKTLI